MIEYVNPIDDPDFNPFTWRDPNPETMSRLRTLAGIWRAATEAMNNARAELYAEVLHARRTGHSYGQIRDVTNLGTGTIQLIEAKAQGLPAP